MSQKNQGKLLPVIEFGDPKATQKATEISQQDIVVPAAAWHGQMRYDPNAKVGHHKDPRKPTRKYYFLP